MLELTHIDEFVDELLREDRVCDVILPRIQVDYICRDKTGRSLTNGRSLSVLV